MQLEYPSNNYVYGWVFVWNGRKSTVRRVLLRVMVVENARFGFRRLSIYHLPRHVHRTLRQVASQSSGRGRRRFGKINSTYRPDDNVIDASLIRVPSDRRLPPHARLHDVPRPVILLRRPRSHVRPRHFFRLQLRRWRQNHRRHDGMLRRSPRRRRRHQRIRP